MFGERSARTGDVGDPDITELNRRVANLIRVGTIAEADYGRALARVRIGELTTDWRPWLTCRAGGDLSWWAPEIGEQVILFSPSGELTLGVILAGMYQQAKPAPADRPTVHRTVYQDGAVVEYDREASRLTVTTPGDVVVDAGRSVTVTAGAEVTVTAASSIAVTSASQVSITAPTVIIAGSGGGNAAASLQGDFALRGNLAVDGNITASGSIIDAGGNTSHHSH